MLKTREKLQSRKYRISNSPNERPPLSKGGLSQQRACGLAIAAVRQPPHSTGIFAFSMIAFIFLLSLVRNSVSFSPGIGGRMVEPVSS
jgi:hypothetical protein